MLELPEEVRNLCKICCVGYCFRGLTLNAAVPGTYFVILLSWNWVNSRDCCSAEIGQVNRDGDVQVLVVEVAARVEHYDWFSSGVAANADCDLHSFIEYLDVTGF